MFPIFLFRIFPSLAYFLSDLDVRIELVGLEELNLEDESVLILARLAVASLVRVSILLRIVDLGAPQLHLSGAFQHLVCVDLAL